MVFTYLSAISFADRPNGIKIALAVHVGSWIAQILAHKFAEKRAPALKDNVIGGEPLNQSIAFTGIRLSNNLLPSKPWS